MSRPRWGTVAMLSLAAVAFALLEGSAPSASPGLAVRVDALGTYNLYTSYPNARREQGYFLRGVNEYATSISSSDPQRTSLWFQSQGAGAFKQFNTTPYRECHWDLLRWGPGKRGFLVYLRTEADCYSDHTAIAFKPGIAYMPKTWTLGERWDVSGVSVTVYGENGVSVCTGNDKWRSRVIGLTAMPGGRRAVHTQTNEIQTLSPIAGAPSSAACPAGQVTTFGWQENFYVAGDLTVRQQDGSPIGSDVGLVRSRGGNPAVARAVGHPQWDSIFESWDAFPPADAGIVTTTTTNVANASSGNTIAFAYIAPSAGVRNSSLTITVPPGWTPPVVADAAGCTTATVGTLTTQDQVITVSALTLPPNGTTLISYGATSGGSCAPGDEATASSMPGAPVWQAQMTLSPGGPFTNLPSSPSINVDGPPTAR